MELTTKRLVLREFAEDDANSVLEYHSIPEFSRYYPWTDRTIDDEIEFVGMFIGWQQEQPRTKFQLAAVLKESGELIGSCGLRMERSDSTEGEIGYGMSPTYWGKGYATEAASEMVRLGFEEFGLHRISAQCIADNVASVRVLEKVGLLEEGRRREAEWMKGRWWDTLVFGILEKEWRARPRPHLK